MEGYYIPYQMLGERFISLMKSNKLLPNELGELFLRMEVFLLHALARLLARGSDASSKTFANLPSDLRKLLVLLLSHG